MEAQTCGKGLAERSTLPARLADLIGALADNLEGHVPALDTSDPSSRKERDAYVGLAGEHRNIAARLTAVADTMAGYRDLPMGRHDMKVMMAPEPLAAFERFVARERDLMAYLQQALRQDERMLEEMRAVPR